jgi:hypothetical protein
MMKIFPTLTFSETDLPRAIATGSLHLVKLVSGITLTLMGIFAAYVVGVVLLLLAVVALLFLLFFVVVVVFFFLSLMFVLIILTLREIKF